MVGSNGSFVESKNALEMAAHFSTIDIGQHSQPIDVARIERCQFGRPDNRRRW